MYIYIVPSTSIEINDIHFLLYSSWSRKGSRSLAEEHWQTANRFVFSIYLFSLFCSYLSISRIFFFNFNLTLGCHLSSWIGQTWICISSSFNVASRGASFSPVASYTSPYILTDAAKVSPSISAAIVCVILNEAFRLLAKALPGVSPLFRGPREGPILQGLRSCLYMMYIRAWSWTLQLHSLWKYCSFLDTRPPMKQIRSLIRSPALYSAVLKKKCNWRFYREYLQVTSRGIESCRNRPHGKRKIPELMAIVTLNKLCISAVPSSCRLALQERQSRSER